MDHQNLIFETQKLFQESNEPNMYYSEFQFSQSLEKVKPADLTHYESVRRMTNFIKIILYLKTNNLQPTQIKFPFVGCDKDKNWGLKHVICYRTKNGAKEWNAYDNSQFQLHSNQDNELIWNLGKIWLRFYTESEINIISQSQNQIHTIIQASVKDEKICKLIKKLLTINTKERLSFQEFVQNEIFAQENFSQNLCSSICMHFQMISQNEKVPNSLNNKKQMKSPFEQEIFRRDTRETLEICYLLEKCTTMIRSMYEKSVDIEFHAFIIKAEAYCIMKKLDQRKIFNRIQDYTVQQKKQYSKFVTKMLTLKQEIERKMKMKIFTSDSGLNSDQKRFLINTDQMNLEKIHPAFKSIIIGYYSQSVAQLKELSAKNEKQEVKLKKICVLERRCLIFLLARLCNQIFSQLRSHIFGEFIKRLQGTKILNIRQLIDFIQSCNEPYPLKVIRNNVHNYGFQQSLSNRKMTSNHE